MVVAFLNDELLPLIQVPEITYHVLGIPWMCQTSCFWLMLNSNTSQSSNNFVVSSTHACAHTCTYTVLTIIHWVNIFACHGKLHWKQVLWFFPCPSVPLSTTLAFHSLWVAHVFIPNSRFTLQCDYTASRNRTVHLRPAYSALASTLPGRIWMLKRCICQLRWVYKRKSFQYRSGKLMN